MVLIRVYLRRSKSKYLPLDDKDKVILNLDGTMTPFGIDMHSFAIDGHYNEQVLYTLY